MTSNLLMSNDRTDQTTQKIISFQSLQTGWRYGEGVPPQPDTVRTALVLNAEALKAGFRKTNAFPGVDGEIQVTAYHQSIYLEMTIEPDGLITFVYEYGHREIEYQEMTVDQVISRIREFRDILWASLDLSISENMTTIKVASAVLPLIRLATGAAFRLLIPTASKEPAATSANILPDFTVRSPEPLHYSGTFQSNYFLKPAASILNQALKGTNATTTSKG